MSNSNYADGDDVFVKGDDGTVEGANITVTVDGSKKRLDVDSKITSFGSGVVESWSPKLRYADMNASTGGVARDTLITDAAWVKLYEYTGSGKVAAFQLNLEDEAKWQVRLVIDSNEIFETSGSGNGVSTIDMNSNSIYSLSSDNHDKYSSLLSGFNITLDHDDIFIFGGLLGKPIYFDTSVKIYAKRAAGKASKKFRAGIIAIEKTT